MIKDNLKRGFPRGSGGNLPAMQETGFHPWIGKIPWRRKWQLTPIFLPGEFHGQKSLVGYSPWGHKESDKTEQLTKFSRRKSEASAGHMKKH